MVRLTYTVFHKHQPTDSYIVTVTKISYARNTGVETWITSDGRAYLVQLVESEPSSGTEVNGSGHEPSPVCAFPPNTRTC